MSKPYDRLPTESDPAWQSLTVYRDMGADRSITAVARQLHKSRPLIGRWSSKYHWIERVKAWDADQDRVRQDAANKAVAKVAGKVAEKREITATRVLEEAAAIAFASLTNAASWTSNALELKSSDELTPEEAAAIESIEIRYDKNGNPIKKIKLHAKGAMLSKLGEHFQLWEKDTPQSQTANFFAVFLEAARSGEIDREMERRGLPSLAPPTHVEPPYVERERQRLEKLHTAQAEAIEVAISVPINNRPSDSAATPVVPPPQNGSRTTLFFTVKRSMSCAIPPTD